MVRIEIEIVQLEGEHVGIRSRVVHGLSLSVEEQVKVRGEGERRIVPFLLSAKRARL